MLHVLILIAALAGTAFVFPTPDDGGRWAAPLPATSPSLPGRRWRDVTPGGPI